MFNAKVFNYATMVLAVLFFLSATISTISEIQQEHNIQMQFTRLLQNVDGFNEQHSTYLDNGTVAPPIVDDENSYQTGREAILAGIENYQNATSYYSQVYTRISFPGLSFPFEVDLWMKNILYPDGDYVQIMAAKEVGNFFGGNGTEMIVFYKADEQKVYRGLQWGIYKKDGEWVSDRTKLNWTVQTLQQFVAEYGAMPNASIYDINPKTLVEETYFKKVRNVKNEIHEYQVQYKLNATLSTKLYLNFINSVLSFVQDDFVRSVNFKELTVSAIVDANGNIKTISFDEKYGFKVYVKQIGGITLSATAYSNMRFVYAFFNQEIPFEKPVIILEQ